MFCILIEKKCAIRQWFHFVKVFIWVLRYTIPMIIWESAIKYYSERHVTCDTVNQGIFFFMCLLMALSGDGNCRVLCTTNLKFLDIFTYLCVKTYRQCMRSSFSCKFMSLHFAFAVSLWHMQMRLWGHHILSGFCVLFPSRVGHSVVRPLPGNS